MNLKLTGGFWNGAADYGPLHYYGSMCTNAVNHGVLIVGYGSESKGTDFCPDATCDVRHHIMF